MEIILWKNCLPLIYHILVRTSFVSTALGNNRLIDNTFDHFD